MSETNDVYGESTNLAVQKGERFFASIGLCDKHGGLRVLGKHDNDLWVSQSVVWEGGSVMWKRDDLMIHEQP